MLDKLRERRARDSLFSTSGKEEDIPIKIKSDFEPKKLEFDQTNDYNMVDVNKLKNNLDQVSIQPQTLGLDERIIFLKYDFSFELENGSAEKTSRGALDLLGEIC